MTILRRYARNLTANWIGYALNLAVMFFLSPFVIHRLGNDLYGVWSLLVSLTGYLGLLELGTRGGLDRFVNYYLGRKEIAKVNGVLSTGLGFFVICGLIMFSAAAILGFIFGSLFTKIPPQWIGDVRWVILLGALSLWLTFFGASFQVVLTSFERFDLTNIISIGVLAIRTAGTVYFLQSGGGIVELAGVQVASTVIGVTASYWTARRIFPQMQLRPSLISKERFSELFAFSVWGFIGQIALQLIYWTDTVVIAILLGPALVTFYSIPMMLLQYGRGLLNQISSVMGPQMIKAGSVGNYNELWEIFRWGSKSIMLLAIPLFTGLIWFGTEFITLWMGPSYKLSGGLLILLTIPQFFMMAVRTGTGIICGLGHVRICTLITLGQAMANLGLTIYLVKVMEMGIHGVAIGTLIPMIFFQIVMGAVILKKINFPLGEFVRELVMRWLAATAGCFLACYAVWMVFGQEGWLGFILKVGSAAVLFVPVMIGLMFSRQERQILRRVIVSEFANRMIESQSFPEPPKTIIEANPVK